VEGATSYVDQKTAKQVCQSFESHRARTRRLHIPVGAINTPPTGSLPGNAEPRLGVNRSVVVRYRSFLESLSSSAATINRRCQSKHTVDRLNPQPGRLRHSISKFSGGQFLSRRSGGLLAVKLVIRSRAATGNPKGGRESVSGVAEKICPLLDSVFRNMAAFTGQLSPTGPLGLEGTIT
jgi:hypothetical protein